MKVHIPVKTDDKGGKDMRADLPDFDFIDDIPVDGTQDARIDVDGTASFGDDAAQPSIRTETVYDAAAGVDNVSAPCTDGGDTTAQTATDAGDEKRLAAVKRAHRSIRCGLPRKQSVFPPHAVRFS